MRLNEGFIGVCGWLCAGIGVAGLFPFSLCMWGIGWGGGGGLAGWPGPGWGRACWLCAKSRALRVRASPSEVYPTGKLQ